MSVVVAHAPDRVGAETARQQALRLHDRVTQASLAPQVLVRLARAVLKLRGHRR